MKKNKELTIAEIEKKVNKFAYKDYVELIKFLYDNHRAVLREWEATRGNLRVEFAGK